MNPSKKTNWNVVILYYLLACAISWPFFWWRDIRPESWLAWQIPTIVKTWTFMWGPGLSVIILSLALGLSFNKKIYVSLFGSSVLKSLLFWFFPFVLLAIPGLPNSWGIDNHLFPIVAMGGLGFISIIGEDMGWSYFLKNVMLNVPPLKRSLIIAVLWEFWHFTNRTQGGTTPPLRYLLVVSIMILFLWGLTYLMSAITDRTKSLVTAVTMHMWVNILSENGCLEVYIVLGVSICFWAYMLFNWDRPLFKKN